MKTAQKVVQGFLRVDPIAEEFLELSVFNYASNDPVRKIDLHGLQGVDNKFSRMMVATGRSTQAMEDAYWDGTWKATKVVLSAIAGEFAALKIAGLFGRGAKTASTSDDLVKNIEKTTKSGARASDEIIHGFTKA